MTFGRTVLFIFGATLIVDSDASDCGYGGCTIGIGPEVAIVWSKEEAILRLT